MEMVSHELQDETIIILFAELARFSKTLEECGNDLERMLYVIMNMGNLKNQPDSLRHEIFNKKPLGSESQAVLLSMYGVSSLTSLTN